MSGKPDRLSKKKTKALGAGAAAELIHASGAAPVSFASFAGGFGAYSSVNATTATGGESNDVVETLECCAYSSSLTRCVQLLECEGLGDDFSLAFKRLNKKDTTTKLKALDELRVCPTHPSRTKTLCLAGSVRSL